MLRILLLICLHPFLNGCKKTPQVVTPQTNHIDVVWQTALTNKTIIGVGYGTPTLCDSEIAFFSRENNENKIIFLYKSNGKQIAIWNDWEGKSSAIIGSVPYYYDQNLVLTNPYGCYVIDVKNHQTLWKNSSVGGAAADVVGNKELFFYREYPASSKYGGGDASLIIGNLKTKNAKEIINVNRNPDTSNAGISQSYFVDYQSNNGTNIYFTYGDWNWYRKIETPNVHSWLAIFSINQNKIVDSIALLDDRDYGSGRGQVVLYNKKIYTSGQYLYCYNSDKSLNWKVSGILNIDGFTLNEQSGIIYASIQDTDPTKPLGFFLKAIDANTGNVLWQKNIGNHCTKPFVMNGVVYITVGPLVAFNASTGEQLFYVYPEDLNASDMSSFKNHNVIGDGERIYVSSGMYAYCLQGK